MKIAVALQNGELAQHFGEAEQFAVFTATATTFEGPEMRTPHHAEGHQHEGGRHNGHNVILETLMGCHCVITSGMGHRVAEALELAGIEPVVSAEPGTPEELARKHSKGQLRRGQYHRCCHS